MTRAAAPPRRVGRRSIRRRRRGATCPSASSVCATANRSRVGDRRRRDRARPARRQVRGRGRRRALGARRTRERVRRHAVGALPAARHRVPLSALGDVEVAVCGALADERLRAACSSAGRGRDRGARRGQRDAPDQPHPQAGVPRRAPARRRGVHARRATGRATRRTSTTRTGRRARSCSRRSTTTARRAARRRSRVQRLYSPRHGTRRHWDRARRRRHARAARLPHHRGGARLRPLLPERARRRPPLDGRPPTIRRSRGSAPRGRSSSRIRACRSSRSKDAGVDGIRVANAPCSYGAFEMTVGVLPERARAETGARRDRGGRATRGPSSARPAISAIARTCTSGSRSGASRSSAATSRSVSASPSTGTKTSRR